MAGRPAGNLDHFLTGLLLVTVLPPALLEGGWITDEITDPVKGPSGSKGR